MLMTSTVSDQKLSAIHHTYPAIPLVTGIPASASILEFGVPQGQLSQRDHKKEASFVHFFLSLHLTRMVSWKWARRIMKLMKLIFPYPLPQYSLFRPFPRACQSTPKTKTTKESPLEPGHPQKHIAPRRYSPHPWCNERASFSPSQKTLCCFPTSLFFGYASFFTSWWKFFLHIQCEPGVWDSHPLSCDERYSQGALFPSNCPVFPNAPDLVPHWCCALICG